MKIIRRTLDSEEARRERQALDVIRRLQHSALIQTTAAWHLEDRLIIVMELASGSIRDRLRECQKEGRAGLPPDELLGYMRDAASALDYLHHNGVLHRDVKPDNILLCNGRAKLGDFSLLREQDRATLHLPMGSPPYMAPEMWLVQAEKASDQYGLACTWAELRCGVRVFAQQSLSAIREAHLKEPPPLALLNPSEQPVLARALAKQPEERFASCQEMVRALEVASGTVSSSSPIALLPARVESAPSPPDSLGSLVASRVDWGGGQDRGKDAPTEKTPTWSKASTKSSWRRPEDGRKWLLVSVLLGLSCLAGLGVLAWSLRSHEMPPVPPAETVSIGFPDAAVCLHPGGAASASRW